MPDAGWATPGVVLPRPAAGPATDLRPLASALDGVLETEPSRLAPAVAVARAEALLAAQDRLAAAALRAVADVEARELWKERAAGSTRTWLRTLPCGDRGQLAAARALAVRPVLSAALAEGSVSLRTAVTVAKHLDRVPAHVPQDQVRAVLVDGVGDLMSVWAGAACLDPTPAQQAEFEARRTRLAEAVRSGLTPWSDAAAQLEPALVLAAQVLAPAEVEAGAALLVDALQPEAELDARAEQEHCERGLVLRRLKGGGWSLRAHLTDEVGQLLSDALTARVPKHPLEEPAEGGEGEPASATPTADQDVPDPLVADRTPAAEDPAPDAEDLLPVDPGAGSDLEPDITGAEPAADRYGAVGPGRPPAEDRLLIEGTPLPSRDQRLHDALAALLVDLVGVRPTSGAATLGHLTITAPLDALDGRPGAPPGRLAVAGGEVALRPSRLREHACRSLLSVVLLDAQGQPVGASGTHRHATARERRVLRTTWGSACAVNGCALPGTVPHHVEPFWKSRQTRQADLAPLCPHHHHDVHEGHRTLRLRDGRLLDEQGWGAGPDAQRRAG